jgi:hypothetical protein
MIPQNNFFFKALTAKTKNNIFVFDIFRGGSLLCTKASPPRPFPKNFTDNLEKAR